VVRGYAADTVNLSNISYADNPRYEETGELYSLKCGIDQVMAHQGDPQDLIISYGDVMAKKYLLQLVVESDADFSIVVDTNWQDSANRGRFADYVECSDPYSREVFGRDISLRRMDTGIDSGRIHGEWTGFFKAGRDSCPRLVEILEQVLSGPSGEQARMHDLFNAMIAQGETVRVIYTTGHWLDIDSIEDLELAARQF